MSEGEGPRRPNDGGEPLPYATPTAHVPPASPGRQVFGVIVRTAGLLLSLNGLNALLAAFYAWTGQLWDRRASNEQYVIEGCVGLAIGVALLRGGWLVRLAYKDER